MRLRRRTRQQRFEHRWRRLMDIPEFRHLIARVARSAAKDAVQEILETYGRPFLPTTESEHLEVTATDTGQKFNSDAFNGGDDEEN